MITHAHSDHARSGSRNYLCATPGKPVLRERIGSDAPVESLTYGKRIKIGGVDVSLHPAGHVLGSAQVRIERSGYICVVSGDYKRQPDRSCESFEPVSCHSFITECTFGLPVFRWPQPESVASQINQWWRVNREQGITSILFAYALGKAQRILALIDPEIGPVGVHGAVARFTPHYDSAGIPLCPHRKITAENRDSFRGCGLIIAPGSTAGTAWLRKFGPVSTAFASGWMLIRGHRKRRPVDRGFVVSDHVDWSDLHQTVDDTGAGFVGAMHGYTDAFVRSLRERGLQAEGVKGYQERHSTEEDD